MQINEAEMRLEMMSLDDIKMNAVRSNIYIPEYAEKEDAIRIVMAYFENDDPAENNDELCQQEEDEDEDEDEDAEEEEENAEEEEENAEEDNLIVQCMNLED